MLFVALFVCLNNLVFRVKVPVGFFVLNLFKKALKNIIFSILTRVSCVCVFVRLMNNKTIKEYKVNLLKGPELVLL